MASLLQQNPWLRDPKDRAKAMRIAAASSSAVEGIRKPYAKDSKGLTVTPRKPRKSAGSRQ